MLNRRRRRVAASSPSMEEVGGSLRDLRRPSQPRQPARERCGFVEDLVDLELAAVVEASRLHSIAGIGEHVIDRGGRGRVARVDQEEAAAGSQRAPHEPPERIEAIGRDMGEPETEEYAVEPGGGRFPFEQVGLEPVDVRRLQPGDVQRKDLGRAVHGNQVRGMARQALRPQPRAAGQFEDVPGGSESVERRSDFVDLREPARVVVGATVVATLPQEPLVVFAGPRAVVRDLLLQRFAHRQGALSRAATEPARVPSRHARPAACGMGGRPRVRRARASGVQIGSQLMTSGERSRR